MQYRAYLVRACRLCALGADDGQGLRVAVLFASLAFFLQKGQAGF